MAFAYLAAELPKLVLGLAVLHLIDIETMWRLAADFTVWWIGSSIVSIALAALVFGLAHRRLYFALAVTQILFEFGVAGSALVRLATIGGNSGTVLTASGSLLIHLGLVLHVRRVFKGTRPTMDPVSGRA